MPAQPGPAARPDGRTERSRRTREAVVQALVDLYEEGDLAPTAQRVAAQAGVALRSVYGHFTDMETLYAEAGQRELERLQAVADIVPADLPLPERLDRFCRSRARVLEHLLPVMRASRLREPFSPQLQRNREQFVATGDAEVLRVFAAEFAPLTADQRSALLDALFLVSAGPAWEALRLDRRLDPAGALAVLTRSVSALFLPGGPA
jgi:TetR/AcrR family transcriptional regulator of autoinduction and epiphytic fitness